MFVSLLLVTFAFDHTFYCRFGLSVKRKTRISANSPEQASMMANTARDPVRFRSPSARSRIIKEHNRP